MKKLQKGFSVFIIIIIVVVLLGALSVFVFIIQKNTPPIPVQQTNQVQTTKNQVQQPKPTLKIIPSESVNTSPLTLNDDTDLNGTVGVNFNHNFTASGGLPPYHFQLETAGGFPPMGIILDANGRLSGIPSVAGTSYFKACVVDTAGKIKCQDITMTIASKFKVTVTSMVCSPDASDWIAQFSGTVVGPVGASFNGPVQINCSAWTGSACTRQQNDPEQSNFSFTDNAGDGWVYELMGWTDNSQNKCINR